LGIAADDDGHTDFGKIEAREGSQQQQLGETNLS